MVVQGSMHLPVVSKPGHGLILLATLEEIGLSPRPVNALRAARVRMVGQLVRLTEVELLRLPSMGRKSVAEVKEKLAELDLTLGDPNVGWHTRTAFEERQRIGPDVRRHLASLRGDSRSSHACLEDELEAALSSVVSGRNRDMLRQLWGFNGQPPTTLEAVGQCYGLTRERVRQLSAKARKQFNRSWRETPILEKVLRLTEGLVPDTEINVTSMLSKASLIRSKFSMESVLLAAEILEKSHGIETDAIAGANVLFRKGCGALLRILPNEFRKATQANGCISIDRLTLKCGGRLEDAEGVQRIISLLPETRWLDEGRNWAMSKQPTRNRVSNLIQKILSVSTTLHISEIRSALSRPHRVTYTAPRAVLLEFCRSTGVASVTGEQVHRPTDFVPAPLGWVEQTFVDAFHSLGSPVAREQLEEFCIDRCGMNIHTFYVYLSYSAVVARLAPGVYSLIGAQIPIGSVEAIRLGHRQTRQSSEHGWTNNGQLWCAIPLDRLAIKIGNLSLPAFVAQLIVGEWMAQFRDELPAGTVNVSDCRVTGIAQSLVMAGAEQGDTVRLTFDLTKRVVVVEVGGDELRSNESAPSGPEEDEFEELG
jgi:hypothetical protein